MQGAIILAAVAIDASAAAGHARAPPRRGSQRLTACALAPRVVANGECGCSRWRSRRDRALRRRRAELPHRRQLLRDHPAQRGARPAGRRADAGASSPAASTCRSARCSGLAAVVFGAAQPAISDLPIAARRRGGAARRRCGRRAQRAAHRPPRHPAAHRHARIAVAVPRHRRRHHPWRRSTTPASRAASSRSGRAISGA